MSDDDKEPRKKIDFRGAKASEEIEFRKTASEQKDQRTVADQDGTQRRHKPANSVSNNVRSFSPTGTVAVKGRRDVNITVTSEETPDRRIEVNLDRNDINLEYQNEGLNVLVYREEEKSERGIDGGLITRLTVTEGEVGKEEILAHFDRGKWVKKPEAFLEKQVVMDALEQDNGIEKADIEHPISQSNENDIDI
ncbi:hypothetical protein [uncultured Roseovarius sp.]|uniref:DUF7678 domain-containing protein n=1 Tax=uncultured Roseovarius sp. TaxID=293344 RepID=UPI0026048EBF|nr:hypothetical protein [uncultured Roseovarius sp.]